MTNPITKRRCAECRMVTTHVLINSWNICELCGYAVNTKPTPQVTWFGP